MIGIYKIVMADGRCYVGQSVRIKHRWSVHRHYLRVGKHHSPYLQNAWTAHGEENFSFEVIESCPVETLVEREQFWIDALKPVFNVSPAAGSAMLGRKHTAETVAKMSAAAMGNQRGKGFVPTLEHLEKMAANGRLSKGRVYGPPSEAVREKISAKQRGVPRPYARVPASEEKKANMRAAALANSENRRRAALTRWANQRAREAACP